MDMKWIAYVHDIAWTAADGTPLGGFAYTYDVVGRITARRHALGTNRFDRAYAYDDLDRDLKKGAYNPLRSLRQLPGYEEEMREIFELLLANCARSFERLPCVEDVDLLRNILYSGVWLKYNCKHAKNPPRAAE